MIAAPRRDRRSRARSALTVLAPAVLAAATVSLVAACWTSSSEGSAMREELTAQTRRLEALEKGAEGERDQLRGAAERAEQKVAQLEKVLEQATQLVTRNSADTGAQVEQMTQQLAALEGQLAEIRNSMEQMQRQLGSQGTELNQRLEQFAKKAGVDLPINASDIPADRTEHFAAAYRAFQQSDHGKARGLFREYLARYRVDDQADNAQYWIGASYLAENRPATALGELRKVIDEFPQGDAVDEAIFDMSEAFYRLHACTDARAALDALIRGHAESPLVTRAREKLRQIDRAPRGYCTS